MEECPRQTADVSLRTADRWARDGEELGRRLRFSHIHRHSPKIFFLGTEPAAHRLLPLKIWGLENSEANFCKDQVIQVKPSPHGDQSNPINSFSLKQKKVFRKHGISSTKKKVFNSTKFTGIAAVYTQAVVQSCSKLTGLNQHNEFYVCQPNRERRYGR